jgi:hypothetical protein
MADDFDNTDEIQNLSDDELREYVLAQLRDEPMLDGDYIGVHVHEGRVTVSGNVGTDEELRILDHFLTDTLGLTNIRNNVVLDELYRKQSPEPIDEHLADEEEHEGLILGDRAQPFTAESEHLADMSELDSIEDPGGTHNVKKAIESAEPWIPPDTPTPEGLTGQEDGNFGIDSQH